MMKKHWLRSVTVSIINFAVARFLVNVEWENTHRLHEPIVNSIPAIAIVLVLTVSAILDWVMPDVGCVVNLSTWFVIVVSQSYVAVHAIWAEEKIGLFVALPVTFFLLLVYFLSWRDTRRRTA